ncbi:MAG: phospholipid carrier-dependent glycosyltransferase, partial [Desulfatirhabdiaceae bacterium]
MDNTSLQGQTNPVVTRGVEKKIALTRHHSFLLAGIVMIGLLLRFYGLNWGLPDRTDLHPDEHDYVVQHALAVSWQNPDPGFINYPSFLCYSTALLHGAMKWLNPDRPDWKAYKSGRMISAIYGILTILVVFCIARHLGGNINGALLAAFWMAILPLHVWDSHIAVTDVMMTFWIMLTLLVSIRLTEDPRPHLAVLAGVCLGLATGSKYTAAI